MIKPVTSSKVKARHLKIAFWGDTGTRKTETVLRYFPHSLLIDTEGNGELCAGHPDIPEFLYIRTKDAYEVAEAVKAASSGEFKFEDGSPVETVSIDGASVLWSMQQEVAYGMAIKRSERYNKKAEEINPSQGDWAKVKRPLRSVSNSINGSPLKYIFYTARQKDLYKEVVNPETHKKELAKIGVAPDWVKGTDYDMNLVMHFYFDENKVWHWEVTKVQGALGKILPIGKTGTEFPISEITSFALTGQALSEASDDEVIEKIVNREEEKVRSFASLKEYAMSLGIPEADFGNVLKSGGWTQYSVSTHDTMEAYLQEWVVANQQRQ